MSDRSTSPPIQAPRRKAFILCFDGTGNKFSGTESDSNILKLYRMLDRSSSDVYTFYQPGIGTYITSHSMQTTSLVGRVGSWYSKIKDSAVGSSFAEHVMGGYRFLMRYYSCEDDLYFFGFSRGAYTARFLAEMLDHIGLLSAGNEELVRFAWKTYAKWASRRAQEKEEEAKLYEFVRGFRETFSRPVRRIRFLGLFDTVNSVPKFESAWMHRSNFPYTARSSAKVIRHAVSIDERRAKFRQDLISGDQAQHEDRIHPSMHRYNSDLANMNLDYNTAEIHGNWRERLPSHVEVPEYDYNMKDETDRPIETDDKSSIHLLRIPSATHRKSDSLVARIDRDMAEQQEKSKPIKQTKARRRQYSDETHQSQDIEEVWFPGAHADIGGGWTRSNQETWMLSHVPLVWMVQEAAKAGLEFDPIKMARANCHPDAVDEYGERSACKETAKRFYSALSESYTGGLIHDSLTAGPCIAKSTAMFWTVLEYMPFRRMDLQPDGSWKAISWPLPMGETRDIPPHAQIHHSAIKRMERDPDYRPGNLIVGGGGRGVRRAPEKYGMGEWKRHKNHDDLVLETYVRADS